MITSKPTPRLSFTFRLSAIVLTFSYFLLFNTNSYSQTKIKNNDFNLSSKTVTSASSNFQSIEISWDFSNAVNRTNTVLNIEIQPINDCWNKLDGKNRSEKITKSFKNIPQNPTGSLLLSLEEYNTKCFKWRAKTINTTTRQEQYTNWQFSSFL
ncbi:hypothetical protein [Oceanihabitans sediminis]|uniref:hypothetical protein n=1 Tax=Oceanihabitans sediminis TaxID=1812012 RepID=UPI00299DB6B4|nr:hypothetical protein [Oceanihabitans sediminis]MDX1278961.1 hypothetical protein [Oceanihabitans sediminis]